MGDIVFLVKSSRNFSMTTHRLNEIASVLGVSVEVFDDPVKPYVLHVGEDGARWLLEIGDRGEPAVRLDSTGAGREQVREGIQAFLAHDVGSPQHRALVALIENLLTMHLAR
ncbi:hypothetical protein [uncultured Methylobacterium sp.]|uniref:hypothetical protein n=1 Tax=uncultured Methylobacterium sp. TaxID=157278 RepID=UPI002594845B|nr:hypothetical protein [uncultured Methylobacterium sp.]